MDDLIDRRIERFVFCELCKHLKTVEAEEGQWDKECGKRLEAEWDDDVECFICEGWEQT